eukprot:3203899-Rhodomonas_salina.2
MSSELVAHFREQSPPPYPNWQEQTPPAQTPLPSHSIPFLNGHRRCPTVASTHNRRTRKPAKHWFLCM